MARLVRFSRMRFVDAVPSPLEQLAGRLQSRKLAENFQLVFGNCSLNLKASCIHLASDCPQDPQPSQLFWGYSEYLFVAVPSQPCD